MAKIQPGDPIVAVKCIGILCLRKPMGQHETKHAGRFDTATCYTMPTDMYQNFYTADGDLRRKYAGANVCKSCMAWWTANLGKADDEDGA